MEVADVNDAFAVEAAAETIKGQVNIDDLDPFAAPALNVDCP